VDSAACLLLPQRLKLITARSLAFLLAASVKFNGLFKTAQRHLKIRD